MTYYDKCDMLSLLDMYIFLKGTVPRKSMHSKIMIWDVRCGLNHGSPTIFKI
jgi:hypothetical protein